ncbi:FAD-binding oxidoreductase [Frigidibacter sp. MR17.14]|uniref:FAD-binding oxidoreductase n=1 Tax=Frigidibacter sp. MR17.14 TaxID=3126509 RepID=UPI003013075C
MRDDATPETGPEAGAPPAALLDRLRRCLPPAALLTGEAIGSAYQEDMRNRPSARPGLVLRPSTTAEVSEALAACSVAGQPVVVQGGRTGLSGGHRVQPGEVVLSLERLNALGLVDPDSRTILADAGVPLQRVQEAAAEAGLMFGVDIGARGTALIGGTIATNAGGIRVLRYGNLRAQVAGLEAVLPDGAVLTSLRGLDKDNTGYDLNGLFIGSEGTLGVVTRALLRLHPAPRVEANALMALPSAEAALALLGRLRGVVGRQLSAFEIMLSDIYGGVVSHLGRAAPLPTGAPVYVLAEIQSEVADDACADRFPEALMAAVEEGLVTDAVIAQSRREFLQLWELRDACAEHLRSLPNRVNCDISVPSARIAGFLDASRAAIRALDPEARFLVFGHIADGNLHYVFQTKAQDAAEACLMRLVADWGGSVSAEHGVGLDKKRWLGLVRSPAELAAMRGIKRALDPAGILNRGRIFDL